LNPSADIRFSVIIPTINRSDILRQAIEALCRQENPGCIYEIIAVDNGSTDNTRDTVGHLAGKSAVPITYLLEPKSGSHFARNTGFKAARGEILGLIDDDVIVDTQWVRNITRVYENPEVSCAGGKLTLRWIHGTPPDWIGPFKEVLGEINHGDRLIELEYPSMINAGNFSIRKDMLFKVGGYNPCNAPGDKLVGDGETGLCLKVYKAGGHIFWVPDATGWHVQDATRVTPRYIRRRGKFQGMSNAYTIYRGSNGHLWQVLRAACRGTRLSILKIASCFLRFRYLKLWKTVVNELLFEINTSSALCSYLLKIYTDARLREQVIRMDWLNI
jgi:glycosyltransferase involved in cell wall biosynthesis